MLDVPGQKEERESKIVLNNQKKELVAHGGKLVSMGRGLRLALWDRRGGFGGRYR